MAASEPYKDPKGLTRALQALAAVDLIFCIAELTLALSTGWPHRVLHGSDLDLRVGILALIMIVQMVVRASGLIVRARWTFRLTANVRRFRAWPASERWAWLGFFIPIVSLWLPANNMQALLFAQRQGSAIMGTTLWTWWLARWATCLSGTFVIFCIVAVAYQHRESGFLSLALFMIPSISGIPCAILGAVMTEVIARQQPSPEALQQAAVF